VKETKIWCSDSSEWVWPFWIW